MDFLMISSIKKYDDGTSMASKPCVTVLFLQYLNQEVGCVCFYER